MGYDRCKDHSMMRCPICAPSTGHAKTPGVAAVAPQNWSPEDALDANLTPNAAPTTPQGLDKQTLEAIERNRIMREGAPVEVEGVDVPISGVVVNDREEVAAKVTHAGQVGDVAGSLATHHVVVGPRITEVSYGGSPIVIVAQEFAEAEQNVIAYQARVDSLLIELTEARDNVAKALVNRDLKKAALQTLIATAP